MEREDAIEALGPMFDAITADGALALKELDLSHDAAVLDVGTGKGYFAICLALNGFNVLTGEPETDRSRYAGQEWAENAEKVGVRDRLRFEAFDASQMPFDAQAFDAVFFFGVLHHVDEGERTKVLGEALRVSKIGGAVVFFEPKQETLEKVWMNDPDHPHAAVPSDYVGAAQVDERRLTGSLMDIYIYKKPASGA